MNLHGMTALPPGKTVGDVLPTFAHVKAEIRIGEPSKVCAGCRKPFTAARKARRALRLYPLACPVPLAWNFPLCGACIAMHRRGGTDRDALLASVEAFHMGEEASE